MSVVVELVDGEIVVQSAGTRVAFTLAVARQIAAVIGSPDKADPGTIESVLTENHPMWDHHSGGDRHKGEGWTLPEALDDARRERRDLPPKASVFFELLLSEPGRLFTSQEICELRPEFGSASAVAGSLNGFVKPADANGRRFPFCWWEGVDGHPTRYAVRPSTAAVFLAAGS